MTERELRSLRYLVVDFLLHSQMNSAMSSLEESVRQHEFTVINVIVLVKDEAGRLGLVGVSDFSFGGTAPPPLGALDLRSTKNALQHLLQHYPNESFVMAILVDRQSMRPLIEALEQLKLPFDVLEMDTVLAAIRDNETTGGSTSEAPETARLKG